MCNQVLRKDVRVVGLFIDGRRFTWFAKHQSTSRGRDKKW
jgi:hypothetical protein